MLLRLVLNGQIIKKEFEMKIVKEETIRRLIKFKGNCCLSCHEDSNNYDIPMCWIDFGKGREGEVCCSVANAFDNWTTKKLLKEEKK